MEISVQGFSKNFTSVDLEMTKKGEVFNQILIAIYSFHICEGFKVGKINKTTKKGTKVRYIPFKSDKELKEYVEKINKMIKECNEKYGSELKELEIGE